MTVPQAYREALEAQRRASELSRALEPAWQRAVAPAWWAWEWLGALAIFVLPPVGAWAASNVPHMPLSAGDSLVFVALPLCLPGGALMLWSLLRRVTTVTLEQDLAAIAPARPGGLPACRGCGAPLVAEPQALVAACAYCRVESLVGGVELARVQARRRAEIRTLTEALTALRSRRRLRTWLAFAVLATVALLGMVLWLAVRAAV